LTLSAAELPTKIKLLTVRLGSNLFRGRTYRTTQATLTEPAQATNLIARPSNVKHIHKLHLQAFTSIRNHGGTTTAAAAATTSAVTITIRTSHFRDFHDSRFDKYCFQQ
jgi:hypothetical protein